MADSADNDLEEVSSISFRKLLHMNQPRAVNARPIFKFFVDI